MSEAAQAIEAARAQLAQRPLDGPAAADVYGADQNLGVHQAAPSLHHQASFPAGFSERVRMQHNAAARGAMPAPAPAPAVNMDGRRQKQNEDMLAKLKKLGMGGSAGGGTHDPSGMADAGMGVGKVGGSLSLGAQSPAG
jgi:hypothetical protein